VTRILTASFCALAVLLSAPHATADDTVPGPDMLYEYFSAQVAGAAERRMERYEALDTNDDIHAYQQRLKDFFVDRIGGMPERTPLNPQVVDTIDGDGYRIEKIIFESQPGFYVTGLMFLPEGDGPFPGVLVPCGHSANGKANEGYQRACILLARNGMAAFIFDPIGQGERHQILDENGKNRTAGTQEHMYTGVNSMLVGRDTATYAIWDGIRAIDYMVSRSDIDAERIGCAGNSGGGTQTAYFMALDDRIKAASPSCYITTFPRLIETIGPQDHEQDIFGQLAFGMDHPDYIIMRAPKPTLICAATEDFFDIQGTWDAYRQAKRIYTRMGYPERVDLAETDTGHGWNEGLRTSMARWMRRWLLEIDDVIVEEDATVLTDEEALCTPEGEVMLLEGARSVFDIHAEMADRFEEERKTKWNGEDLNDRLAKVRELANVRALNDLPEPTAELRNNAAIQGGRSVELWIRPEPGIVLPVTLLIPENADGALQLLLDGQGRQNAMMQSRAQELFAAGHPVALADLRGIGDTESNRGPKGWGPLFGPDWQETMLAFLLGESMVGLRAEDTMQLARALQTAKIDGLPEQRTIHLIANGEAVPAALHAAALTPQLYTDLTLDSPIISWTEVVHTPLIRHQFINAVYGALKEYDLPDLQHAYKKQKNAS
jgi:dienelactone hydrolase